MKIRKGFVSNSSSSSFIIIGTEISKLISDEELLDEMCKNSALEYHESDPNSCDDSLYLGMSPDKMCDDETLIQFKERIIDEMNKRYKECQNVDDIKFEDHFKEMEENETLMEFKKRIEDKLRRKPLDIGPKDLSFIFEAWYDG